MQPPIAKALFKTLRQMRESVEMDRRTDVLVFVALCMFEHEMLKEEKLRRERRSRKGGTDVYGGA